MKKLVGPFARVLGSLFAVGVFVIIISLSYSALGRIFRDSLFDQAAGLLLFDVAAVIWFMQFVGNSRSVSQYVFSGLGFLLGLAGSVGLVGIEVGISSGMLLAGEMTKPLSYIFIAAAVGHLVVVYAFHASEPEVSATISLGVEKAKVQEEGMRQAEQSMSQHAHAMGSVISSRLVKEVLHDLDMQPDVIDGKLLPMDDSLHANSIGYPLKEQAVSGVGVNVLSCGHNQGVKNNFVTGKYECRVCGAVVDVDLLQKAGASFFSNPGEWLKQRVGRKAAQGPMVDDRVVFVRKQDGSLERLFCMKCKVQGKPWATPDPCEHMANVKGEPISVERIAQTLKDGFQDDAVG